MSALHTDEKGIVVPCPSCGQKNRIPYEKLGTTGKCGKCGTALVVNAPVDVTDGAQFQRLITASLLPVVVDFWAPWCGPCRMVAPEIEKVAAQEVGRLVVAKVNTQVLTDVAGRYNVMSIPTMAVFADGREVNRTMGARPAAEIMAFVHQSLGMAGAR